MDDFLSPYEFANYVTLGASDTIISGSKDRVSKVSDSPADFSDFVKIIVKGEE